MNGYRKQLGRTGEKIAGDYYLSRGYSIIDVNYRCRIGEIDLILEKNNRLIFAEVKTRRSLKFGSPEENVDLRKQAKIRKVAEYYLHGTNKKYTNISFDVVTVIIDAGNANKYTINHIENAF